MLGVGIDRAEELHLVALGSPGKVTRIAAAEPDPDVRVVFEDRHRLLFEALVHAACHSVDQRRPGGPRRGPARKSWGLANCRQRMHLANAVP
jgi:hypothetical protein